MAVEVTTSVSPRATPAWTPGSSVSCSIPPAAGHPVEVHLGGIGRRRHHEVVAQRPRHRAHLQVGGGQRLTVGHQPPGSVPVHEGGQPTAPPAGRARGELDPAGVLVAPALGRRPAGRIGAEHDQRALVARLDDERERLALGPLHLGQVGKGPAVPGHLDRRRGRSPHSHHEQTDVGVGRPRRRVAQHRGLGRPDWPASATCQRPTGPTSTRATASDLPSGAHQNPRDRPISSAATNSADPQETSGSASARGRSRLAGHQPVRLRRADQAQPAPGHVGHRPAVGRQSGVEGTGLGLQARGRTRVEIDDEQPAAEPEAGSPTGGVEGVGDDPTGRLPGPLPPPGLGLGQVLGPRRVGQQHGRIADQALLARAGVQHPEAVHRVRAAPGAQEHDPLPVGGDAERARLAQREAPGAGRPAGEAVAAAAHTVRRVIRVGEPTVRRPAGRNPRRDAIMAAGSTGGAHPAIGRPSGHSLAPRDVDHRRCPT